MLYAEICPKVRRHNAQPWDIFRHITWTTQYYCIIRFCSLLWRRSDIDSFVWGDGGSDFVSLVRYWAPPINMAVLGFRFSKLSEILGTIYKHGCTGF